MAEPTSLASVLAEVGPRLRRLRDERGVTLAELATATGISKSTLSRLESGQRKPSLELLLPIAEAHQVPLDDLVGAPEVGDPRIRLRPQDRNGRIVVPLTRQPGGIQAWKVVIQPSGEEPSLRIHEGYEWLYVLAGQLRLVVADHDIELGPGSATEWTSATYPFSQDAGPVGGLEPLLLPWSGSRPARYRWTGSGFSK